MKGLALFLVHVCFISVLDIRPLVGRLRQLHADFCHFIVTLEAYINKYSSLVPFLADNATGTPASDAPPPEQTPKAISLQVIPEEFVLLTIKGCLRYNYLFIQ